MIEPKTDFCECCEEEWEADFFCQTCSEMEHFEEHEADEPDPFYDGSGSDTHTVQRQEWVTYRTCLNCCGCYFLETSGTPPTQHIIDDEEIPF